MPISVLIPTKNEAQDLLGCLASLSWCDDIQVFDSYSTDATVTLAQAAGAKVTQRVFDGYASQKNAALHSLSFKHRWVLLLDADERVTPALVAEMQAWVKSAPEEVAAVRIQRRDYLFGTWLKHAQISPWYLRLVRPERVKFEREVNEVLVPDGEVAELNEPFDHYPFSKGFAHWIEKHNRYSSMEAQRALEERRGDVPFSFKKALLASDFHERRYHQKGFFYRLPCRPLIKFFYMMVVRRAVLDGRAGVTYASLQAIYEYFIILKEREMANCQCNVLPLDHSNGKG
jgi:glycosyltransferase involved in cell wall biosynthesis